MRGQSAGAGSLSVWTHHLKGYEFLPSYSIGDYQGKAARVAAGVEGYELGTHMRTDNVTIVIPGGSTVGPIGGFFQGGGHSSYTSFYGLGADQILAIEVVTADGRFVTADPNNNTDLFWALRGGGGGEEHGIHDNIEHADGLQEPTALSLRQSPRHTIQRPWDSRASYSPPPTYPNMLQRSPTRASGPAFAHTSNSDLRSAMPEALATTL